MGEKMIMNVGHTSGVPLPFRIVMEIYRKCAHRMMNAFETLSDNIPSTAPDGLVCAKMMYDIQEQFIRSGIAELSFPRRVKLPDPNKGDDRPYKTPSIPYGIDTRLENACQKLASDGSSSDSSSSHVRQIYLDAAGFMLGQMADHIEKRPSIAECPELMNGFIVCANKFLARGVGQQEALSESQIKELPPSIQKSITAIRDAFPKRLT